MRPADSRRTAFACFGILIAAAPAVGVAQDSPHGDFDRECVECHDTASWVVPAAPLRFDHAAVGFPLLGGHAGVACRDCHRSLVFAHVGVACADCHADVHHGELGFDCEACHRVGTWENRADMIERHEGLAFPLSGAHAWVDCGACHRGQPGAEYTQVSAECVACHEADYLGARAPDHVQAGFPTTCQDCHAVFATSWGTSSFQHPPTFPLRGAHAAARCAACHADGLGSLPTDCYACHAAEYDATVDPDHAAAAFPTDCRVCHDENAWAPAEYRHDLTGFPLTGAHARALCSDCHQSGYAGTPRDCVACHQLEYDATSDPPHPAAGFPTDCERCHTTSAWVPSTWDHDTLFPIDSGRHRDEWNACVDCHVQPSDFSIFECIFCHEHNQADTDQDHGDVSGYAYLSSACLECHPRGEED